MIQSKYGENVWENKKCLGLKIVSVKFKILNNKRKKKKEVTLEFLQNQKLSLRIPPKSEIESNPRGCPDMALPGQQNVWSQSGSVAIFP